MFTTTQLIAYSIAALLLTISPGPDTFLVIGNSIAGGVKRGVATALGTTSGGLVHIGLFALGLAQLLVYSATAFLVVKTIGAVYLIYLGAKALRSAFKTAQVMPVSATRGKQTTTWREWRAAWGQGVLSNALNPKVAVFYLAFLPQFMSPNDPIVLKSAILISIHYAMGLVWLSIVAFTVARLGHWLARGVVRRWLDGVVGAVMVFFGLRLALTR